MSTDTESFYPENREQWRNWLEKNHESQSSVWLICYKKNSGYPTISWSEAVDEAICFGWIDSTRKSLDDKKFQQYFSKRKATSFWSKVNKDKVKRLIDEGLMTPAGLKSIETAKQNGSWTIMDEAEALVIPKDLEAAFQKSPGSKDFYLSLSKSVRKSILHWLVLAKREETRQKRIREIIQSTAQGIKPKPFG